jgi:catechol 2,3-dioxygenase-like lactoylglutathione lyase family enzyme
MFDHVTVTVGDFPNAKSFYEAALGALNMKALAGDNQSYCGFGVGRLMFWIAAAESPTPGSTSVHVAFIGTNKDQVNGFYQAALAAGAKDNGAPGYHRKYGPGYYAAFVFDLDGNNIETVYRDPTVR